MAKKTKADILQENQEKWFQEISKTKKPGQDTWTNALMRTEALERGDPSGVIAESDRNWKKKGDPDGTIALSNKMISSFKEAGVWNGKAVAGKKAAAKTGTRKK